MIDDWTQISWWESRGRHEPADVVWACRTGGRYAGRIAVNTTDGIYDSLSTAARAALTLQATQSGSAYSGVINLGVRVV